MPDKHYVTVKAAIWKGDKLLLQKEREIESGRIVWDLPGGRIDIGENLVDCLKREIKEEIGVEAINIGELPVKMWSTMSKGGDSVIAVLFEVELASEAYQFNNAAGEAWEVLEAAYLTAEEFESVEEDEFSHIPFIKEYFRDRK